jgi:hypothetical protein
MEKTYSSKTLFSPSKVVIIIYPSQRNVVVAGASKVRNVTLQGHPSNGSGDKTKKV